jgi:arsenate reductase
MLTVYGLKNCDTCRKARKWLDAKKITHRFIDVRDDGVAPAMITTWVRELGLDAVVNRRSTTWRELPVSERETLTSSNAARFLVAHPTLIKRPVFDNNGKLAIGFTDATKKALGG